jgi:probable phosphoglycerate mutase
MKLLFIRHGQSRGNVKGRWQGWLDEPLTRHGRKQAHLLAERLRVWSVENAEPVLAVYSSTLARAYQTAAILAHHWEAPLVLDGRLRERHVGGLQGLTWPEIEVRFPDVALTIQRNWTVPKLPGGETTYEFSERVNQAVSDIVVRANDRELAGSFAIVSHGGTINAYFSRVIGREDDMPFMFHFGNSSLSVIDVHNGRARISLVNDICHLE